MTSGQPFKIVRWLIAITAASLAGCSSAMPSLTGSTSSIDRTFIGAAQTWDFDKDGAVTCDEWKNYAATLLRESDADGDGSLNDLEFQKMAKTDQLFSVADRSYYDANGDGRVTVEEITGKPNAAFKQLDKNGDCRIDRNESVRILPVDAPKASTAPNTDQQVPGSR
jgi:Ca2+-binding EF-hand superfamily protein